MRRFLIIIAMLFMSVNAFGSDGTIKDQTELAETMAVADEVVLWDASTGLTKKITYLNLNDLPNLDAYGGLTAAVATISTTVKTVLCASTQTVSDDLTVPVTMTIFALQECSLNPATGKTLTIESSIIAGAYDIVGGAGTVTFSGPGMIDAAWNSGTAGDKTITGSLDMSDDNITSVGDIELDTISNEDGSLSMTIAASTGSVGFASDSDYAGNYALQLQNIPDLAAKGPAYWFNGDDDYINHGVNDLFGTGDFSIIISALINSSTGTLITNRRFNSGFAISLAAGKVKLELDESVSGFVAYAFDGTAINDGKQHVLGIIGDRDGNAYNYLEGKIDGTNQDISGSSGALFEDESITIGNRPISFNSGVSGEMNRLLCFNLALSADEVKAFSSGAPVLQKWLKNGTDKPSELRDSGNFVIGAAYIITTHTDGDFQSAGAADDNVDTEFIATATAAGVLDGGDTATRLGAVLNLPRSGIMHSQWIDASGTELHGTASAPSVGPLAINLATNHGEKYIQKTITGDTLWANIVPPGYMLKYILFEETAGNEATLDMGTSDGANDVFTGETIAASAITVVQINKVFSMSSAQTLDLNDDQGGSSWNSGSVDVTLVSERVGME